MTPGRCHRCLTKAPTRFTSGCRQTSQSAGMRTISAPAIADSPRFGAHLVRCSRTNLLCAPSHVGSRAAFDGRGEHHPCVYPSGEMPSLPVHRRDFISARGEARHDNFDDAGERLNDWMRRHLRVAVAPQPKPGNVERELIALAQAPLNLTGWTNPYAADIKARRKSCADQARRDHPR